MKNQDFIDAINLVSFIIGVLNYQENLTQNDKQEIIEEFNKKLKIVLDQIHEHLANQDKKMDMILELLQEK